MEPLKKLRNDLRATTGVEINKEDILGFSKTVVLTTAGSPDPLKREDHDNGAPKFELTIRKDKRLSIYVYQRDIVIGDMFTKLDSIQYFGRYDDADDPKSSYFIYHAPNSFDSILIIGAIFHKAVERYYL